MSQINLDYHTIFNGKKIPLYCGLWVNGLHGLPEKAQITCIAGLVGKSVPITISYEPDTERARESAEVVAAWLHHSGYTSITIAPKEQPCQTPKKSKQP